MKKSYRKRYKDKRKFLFGKDVIAPKVWHRKASVRTVWYRDLRMFTLIEFNKIDNGFIDIHAQKRVNWTLLMMHGYKQRKKRHV